MLIVINNANIYADIIRIIRKNAYLCSRLIIITIQRKEKPLIITKNDTNKL